MGWDIDHIMWHLVRDKILKDRYAGCAYSAATSFSPVIIRYRDEVSQKEKSKIAKLFPKDIRVEFQQVDYEGEDVYLYGKGNFMLDSLGIAIVKFLEKYTTEEYTKESGNWKKK